MQPAIRSAMPTATRWASLVVSDIGAKDMVGLADQIYVVLHRKHRVTCSAQAQQYRNEVAYIRRV